MAQSRCRSCPPVAWSDTYARRTYGHRNTRPATDSIDSTAVEGTQGRQAGRQKLLKETSMGTDAGRANSEGPRPGETDPKPPKWLVRVVHALVPPDLGSPNELIDVLLETHGSIPQAVLRIPAAI